MSQRGTRAGVSYHAARRRACWVGLVISAVCAVLDRDVARQQKLTEKRTVLVTGWYFLIAEKTVSNTVQIVKKVCLLRGVWLVNS